MSKRNLLVVVALVVTLAVVVGCSAQAAGTATPAVSAATSAVGGATAAPAAGGTVAAAAAEVVLKNFAFSPKELTVSVGTTVTWVNQDTVAHTVTAGQRGSPSGMFDSGELAAGKSFSFTFTQAGTYPYFCAVHSNMDGTITVQ